MMSQQQRLIQLPLVSMLLLCLLAGVYLFASKRSSKKRKSSSSIEKHSVDTPSEEVLKYWTADKMRNAKPVELPNVKLPERGKKK